MIWVVWTGTRTGLDNEDFGAHICTTKDEVEDAAASMPVRTIYSDGHGLPTADIFDQDRIFFPNKPELRVRGSVEKLAQWRLRKRDLSCIRIGYHGTDLNT